MAALPISKLSCLFMAGAVWCMGQSEQTTAMHWADYYAGVYSVPREFVHAIIEVESAWQPHAISTKGAAGLMQLMPATAVTFGVTNRFEVQQNIRGGVAYLAYLSQMFKGDLRLVTAAYLAGESRILSAGLQYSNAEVFEYVSKVARVYQQKRLKRLRTKPLVESPNQGGNSP
jgi:soluble lytic murein transglycosylase-like protein